MNRKGVIKKVTGLEATNVATDCKPEAQSLDYVGALPGSVNKKTKKRGMTNREISAALGIRPATVKRHVERIYARVGVHTRAGVTAYWVLAAGSLDRLSSPTVPAGHSEGRAVEDVAGR